MKAILLKEHGDSSKLYLGETEIPKIKNNEVLIKVHATALNRADILQRQGKYPPPEGASTILGLEYAGEIVDGSGDWQKLHKKGDRVMGIVAGGGYGEYVTTPVEHLMPIPSNLSFEQAAAISEVFLTAYQCLFWHGELKEGESVLIHAGGSGVGTAAIQLSKSINVKEIIVTAGSKEKLAACRELGATLGVNYKEEDFAACTDKHTKNHGVDVILDFIGAPYWEKNISSLARDGRLVLIASMGGDTVSDMSIPKLFQKRAKVISTTLRSRTDGYKAKLTKEFALWALPLFQSGSLKPVISKVLPWSEVSSAHQMMEKNENTGKIVLTIDLL